MLQLLKESVSSRHAERLEQIVIALIGIEIGQIFPPWAWSTADLNLLSLVLGIITILVDAMA